MTASSSSNSTQIQARKETIRELANRHLKDPNHTTTDEEIRNAKVVIDEMVEMDEDVERMFRVDNSTVL